MKKLLKTVLKIIAIIILFFVLAIFCTETEFNITVIVLLITTLLLACFHKISKAWPISIFVLVLFILGVDFLANIFEEEQQRKSEHYTQLLEDFIKSPVNNIPDETVFNGMKRYGKDDWKYLEDKKLYVDKEGKPITGIIYEEMESIFGFQSIKNGEFDGYHLLYAKRNPKQLRSFSYAENNTLKKIVIFNDKGKLLNAGNLTDEYTIAIRYSLDGKLLWASFNDKILQPYIILYAYDKNGNQIIKMNTYEHKAVCLLKDGSERKMTGKEINQIFEENDKIADNQTDTPNYPCQWEEAK